jgi:hypothetical protein
VLVWHRGQARAGKVFKRTNKTTPRKERGIFVNLPPRGEFQRNPICNRETEIWTRNAIELQR